MSIKLTYFNVKGRAEVTRLMFDYGNVKFEDVRLTEGFTDEIKKSTPLGQLPMLQVGEVKSGESMAIARYAAKRAGLYPKNEESAMVVDMITQVLFTIINEGGRIHFALKDQEKEDAIKTLLNETLPKQFGHLSNLIKSDKNTFIPDELSMADFLLYDLLVNMFQIFPDFDITQYPKLQAVVDNVSKLPAVQARA